MPLEIERKFLVNDLAILDNLQNGFFIIQGYISLDAHRIVRVRTKGEKAYLTIKSKISQMTRSEYEYEIPFDHALELLNNVCLKPLIQKTRYNVVENGLTWEIDIFEGVFEGIIIAEVELNSEDTSVELPTWIGEEVTDDMAYYNAEMVKRHMNKQNP